MRATLATCGFWSAIVLILLVRSYHARNCRTDYNDLGSKTIRSSLVFEGVAKSRISLAQHPHIHRIEFEVRNVLKGELGRNSKSRRILVGDFGQPDVDNCVAPDVTIDSRYLVFVDGPSSPHADEKLPRISTNRSANSKYSGSAGSLVYYVSSFPETASGKAIKEVRSSACKDCGLPPKITKQPKNTTEMAKRKLRLHCRASGKPSPRITWFKNGVSLNKDKRITIKESRRDSRLQIKNADDRDAGVYRCQATNLLGNASSQDIWVNVTGGSGKKPFSIRCTDQSFCLNGGICYEMTQLKKHYCECAKSFVGLRCEEKVTGRNAQMVAGKEIYRYIKRKRKRHLQHHRL